MEPTRECSLGSTTSVRLTPSAPGGHCSAFTVPISKTRMAHAAMVLRMIPFKPPFGQVWLDVRMQHNRPLVVSAEFRGDSSVAGRRPVASLPRIDCRACALPLVQVAKQGDGLIASAELDGCARSGPPVLRSERIAHPRRLLRCALIGWVTALRQRLEFDVLCAPDNPHMAGMPPRLTSRDELFRVRWSHHGARYAD